MVAVSLQALFHFLPVLQISTK